MISHNSLPGYAPIRFNSKDCGVISVVKLDLWVSELCIVNVHEHWYTAWCYSSWGDTHDLMGIPPGWTDERKVREKWSHTHELQLELDQPQTQIADNKVLGNCCELKIEVKLFFLQEFLIKWEL